MKPALFLPILLAASPAAAHAILVSSTPDINGSLPAGHETVVMHFNSRIDTARSRLTLVGPAASEVRLPIAPDAAAGAMTAAADLQAGAYTLRWQVLAVDGHITRGEVPFTVTAP